ncbi:uncharacterized protein JCM6883_003769 [Sporobolomyces salmoneus]|uniref:uncharacterized protein n=1 Tax=Sporobolomyces salmoneus TaxID=183962 RepID=UPI00317BA822
MLMKLVEPEQAAPSDTEEEEEKDTPPLDDLLFVLNSTPSLVRLNFDDGHFNFPSSIIIEAASTLPRLQVFDFSTGGRIDWTLETTKAFDVGFPVIEDITIKSEEVSFPEDIPDAVALSTPRKKLKILDISIQEDPIAASKLTTHLLQRLDPMILSRCFFDGSLVRNVNYDFLATCSSLTHLHLTTCPDDVPDSFAALLQHISRLSSLQHVEFRVYLRSWAINVVAEPNVDLGRVLEVFPPSLRKFVMHLKLNDWESIPERRIPESPHPAPIQLSAYRPVGKNDARRTIAWKDEKIEGGGENWYRCEVKRGIQV